jgi:hypothetical protein
MTFLIHRLRLRLEEVKLEGRTFLIRFILDWDGKSRNEIRNEKTKELYQVEEDRFCLIEFFFFSL